MGQVFTFDFLPDTSVACDITDLSKQFDVIIEL